MKRQSYQTDNPTFDTVNTVNEPEVAYTYINQNDCESAILRFDEVSSKPQILLEPDDKLRRAITIEELKEKVVVMIDRLDRKYAKK